MYEKNAEENMVEVIKWQIKMEEPRSLGKLNKGKMWGRQEEGNSSKGDFRDKTSIGIWGPWPGPGLMIQFQEMTISDINA